MTPKTLQELDEFLSRWLKPVDYPTCMSMPEAFRGRLKEAGLVIVPREPTEEMIKARYWHRGTQQPILEGHPKAAMGEDEIAEYWAEDREQVVSAEKAEHRAMLAASPYRGQNDE